jgi:hypothetical protein
MYACVIQIGADCSRGCALPTIAYTLLLTHLHLTVRELASASLSKAERGS